MKLINNTLMVVLLCCAGISSVMAQSQPANSIEAVSVAKQGGDIAVRIDLKEALEKPPAGFSMSSPAKIALDFPSTANGLGKNSQVLNEGDLTSMNVVQAGERTRLVLNLVKNMNYSTRIEGKSLYVTLTPIVRAGESMAQRVTRFSEESAIGQKHVIRDVVFRRGKDGEGRIVVDMSDAGTGIDIRQQGSSLVVDFVKTSAPDHLKRKLDVLDFATPVSSIETKAQGENIRMTISPKGLWEHTAYQADNQFVVEVKKIIEDPNKLVQGTKVGYQGPRVSINYQNGDVRALLRLMAEELGLNAVISDTVTGATTLVLKDVPADQVIDIIFQQKGLDMRKKGNIIMIAPRDEIATREKLEFESKQQNSDLEPLKLEQFVMNYQKASDVARLLQGLLVAAPGAAAAPVAPAATPGVNPSRLLSKRGSAIADPQSNILFVNDIPSKLEEIRSFIKAIDIGARQVLIEARVVEANDTFNRELGVKMNLLTSAKNGNSGGGLYSPPASQLGGLGTVNEYINQNVNVLNNSTSGLNLNSAKTVTSSFGNNGVQISPNALGVNLPSFTNTGGTLAFSLFTASMSKVLNLEIAALESDGIGKIISSPRVITANNKKAKIEDGTEIPYVVSTISGSGTTQTVMFKKAMLSLEAEPQITPEGTIRLLLTVKKDEPDWNRSILGNPPIKSSTVETTVVVDNGGTVVIGGVFITDTQNAVDKVPFLGDIPVIGWLFKYKQEVGKRRELLVFITPRIVSDKLRFD
jgi:type IV pilus assembly protein PilQ